VQRRFSHLQLLVIVCALLESPVASHADSCVMFHKRAPVRAVCGKIINEVGEPPDGVELTLATESGSSLFTAKTDKRGRFAFGPVPKGDYTLRATAPSYLSEQRPIRVTRDRDNTCKAMIEVKLGTSSCRGGIYVTGIDKQSDPN
jgi:Carboxypeptidase regulatory-like domain